MQDINKLQVPSPDQRPPSPKKESVSSLTTSKKGTIHTFANVTWRYFCESCVKNGAIVWHGALQGSVNTELLAET